MYFPPSLKSLNLIYESPNLTFASTSSPSILSALEKGSVLSALDIKSLLKIILINRRLIITTTALFAIIALIYSLTLSNIYQSTALLSPVDDQSGSSASLNNIGGLASLAGINISSSSGGNSTKAITKITTLSFFEENIFFYLTLIDQQY